MPGLWDNLVAAFACLSSSAHAGMAEEGVEADFILLADDALANFGDIDEDGVSNIEEFWRPRGRAAPRRLRGGRAGPGSGRRRHAPLPWH